MGHEAQGSAVLDRPALCVCVCVWFAVLNDLAGFLLLILCWFWHSGIILFPFTLPISTEGTLIKEGELSLKVA